VTQAIEHLLCKHKALSSNPSPTKKIAHDDFGSWLTTFFLSTITMF
jgi:hypothetical protein